MLLRCTCMAAHRCQSKKIKITKIKKIKQKNENKIIEKMKKILFRKKSYKITTAHECQIWFLVTRLDI